MNKNIIFILILTVIALITLYLYSFGPLAGTRTAQNFNPASLQPAAQTQKLTVGAKEQTFNTYHNKDLKENFYTVQLPQDWKTQAGKNPGSYNSSNASGTATVELMDVPDNSTLELFVLSQDEPKLKNSLAGYNRTDYKKITINGSEAYQLIYTTQTNGGANQTIRTYISGTDHATLITLVAKQADFVNVQPLFTSIINSFSWENK